MVTEPQPGCAVLVVANTGPVVLKRMRWRIFLSRSGGCGRSGPGVTRVWGWGCRSCGRWCGRMTGASRLSLGRVAVW